MSTKLLLSLFTVVLVATTALACSAPEPSPLPTLETWMGYPVTTPGRPDGGYPGPIPLETDVAAQTPEPPTDAPMPISGKASISGVLYSFTIARVVPGTMFYLTHALGDDHRLMPPVLMGPNDQNGDIRAYSNPKGQFSLHDVTPGNYFLIVSAPYNWAVGQISGTDSTPLLIELAAGDRKVLGIVYLPWP